MRRKKHKHTRKAMNFYKISYGFHEPYKVLLDGNFIYATGQSNMSDLATHIPKLLGGRCKLFTCRCVTSELKRMGPEFAQSAQAARNFSLHKCGHDTPVAAADCIKEQLGDANSGHWLVASQDTALRGALGRVPGVPLLFASVNGLHLETPSEMAKATAQQEVEATQSVPAHERATAALADLETLRPKETSAVKFRRKHAKGPNPLAAKRKISKAPPRKAAREAGGGGGGGGGGGSGGGDEGAAKKQRKRVRGKGAAGKDSGAGSD